MTKHTWLRTRIPPWLRASGCLRRIGNAVDPVKVVPVVPAGRAVLNVVALRIASLLMRGHERP